ncbi:outer membrane protein with beta-barrel domain [Aquimarina sp. MAR_2010_214]|uniref:outer membrane beta-barrel protein n=1 Tax=Aquimarina sp. MAR_2010_214 TaxID=1250026 RepID=UPI000C70B264|nr:outer membrane beta-barrel protein [Aquimarina sp. MAR_2010_214]PKV51984.1 outer membrane protein with beta-barrel domain [Aquimarina sp. MAR_2010_214]
MKKILLFTAVALLGLTATHAQVKFGFGVGYAVPSGDVADITDGGFSGYLELGYGITENIDVSLLYQGDLLLGEDLNNIGYEIGNVFISSFIANGRYFLNDDGFRPYVGFGMGLASVSQANYALGDGNALGGFDTETNFVVRPSLGFKYGILNINAAYLNAGKIGEGDEKNTVSDFSFNVGLLFTFGGK